MNHVSERAFREWLTTEGVAIPIHTGMTADEIEGDEQRIQCYCGESTHKAGPLYTATMSILLITPPHSNEEDSGTLSLDDHKSVLATLRNLIENYDENSLETVYGQETPYRFAGGFVNGEEGMIEENSWVAKIDFLFGIDTTG